MGYLVSVLTPLVASLTLVASVWADADPANRTGDPEKLGRVLFKTSCTPEAQEQFERALAMLHSFFFPETMKAFTAIPETDPSCAIAYWGIAISQRPNPLVGPFDAATLKRGLEAIEKGKAIGAKTQRERDWLAAIEEFYKDYDKVDQDTRAKNYEKAMEALAKKYPDDVEAKMFYALALNETFDHKTMDTLVKAIEILEPIDKQYPDHPGVTHYLIHSYDFPAIADRGVPAANKYAKIAPAAPHAQHMPSHIYSMVGMWERLDRVQSGVGRGGQGICRSKQARRRARRRSARVRLHGVRLSAARPGCQGKGPDRGERRDQEGGRDRTGGQTARAAVPARYMLERQDWRGAAQLQPLGIAYPAGRGHHALRARDGRGAQRRRRRCAGGYRQAEGACAQRLEKANQGYWAGQVEIQVLGCPGLDRPGPRQAGAEALKFMRAAADLEDGSEKHVAMENRLYPMRELLADMLMAHGEAAGAEGIRSVDEERAERLRGFYGAAKAAEAVGRREEGARVLREARAAHAERGRGSARAARGEAAARQQVTM